MYERDLVRVRNSRWAYPTQRQPNTTPANIRLGTHDITNTHYPWLTSLWFFIVSASFQTFLLNGEFNKSVELYSLVFECFQCENSTKCFNSSALAAHWYNSHNPQYWEYPTGQDRCQHSRGSTPSHYKKYTIQNHQKRSQKVSFRFLKTRLKVQQIQYILLIGNRLKIIFQTVSAWKLTCSRSQSIALQLPVHQGNIFWPMGIHIQVCPHIQHLCTPAVRSLFFEEDNDVLFAKQMRKMLQDTKGQSSVGKITRKSWKVSGSENEITVSNSSWLHPSAFST